MNLKKKHTLGPEGNTKWTAVQPTHKQQLGCSALANAEVCHHCSITDLSRSLYFFGWAHPETLFSFHSRPSLLPTFCRSVTFPPLFCPPSASLCGMQITSGEAIIRRWQCKKNTKERVSRLSVDVVGLKLWTVLLVVVASAPGFRRPPLSRPLWWDQLSHSNGMTLPDTHQPGHWHTHTPAPEVD